MNKITDLRELDELAKSLLGEEKANEIIKSTSINEDEPFNSEEDEESFSTDFVAEMNRKLADHNASIKAQLSVKA